MRVQREIEMFSHRLVYNVSAFNKNTGGYPVLRVMIMRLKDKKAIHLESTWPRDLTVAVSSSPMPIKYLRNTENQFLWVSKL